MKMRSTLGDRREHAVPCRYCQRSTWTLDRICDRCGETTALAEWHASAGLVTVDDEMRRDARRDSVVPRGW